MRRSPPCLPRLCSCFPPAPLQRGTVGMKVYCDTALMLSHGHSVSRERWASILGKSAPSSRTPSFLCSPPSPPPPHFRSYCPAACCPEGSAQRWMHISSCFPPLQDLLKGQLLSRVSSSHRMSMRPAFLTRPGARSCISNFRLFHYTSFF